MLSDASEINRQYNGSEELKQQQRKRRKTKPINDFYDAVFLICRAGKTIIELIRLPWHLLNPANVPHATNADSNQPLSEITFSFLISQTCFWVAGTGAAGIANKRFASEYL